MWKETVRREAEKRWVLDDAPTTEIIMLNVIYFYDREGMDVDNIVKPIQDALEGLVYLDDDQVTDVLSQKRDLNSNFRVRRASSVLMEGLERQNPFLYIRIEKAPDQEVLS